MTREQRANRGTALIRGVLNDILRSRKGETVLIIDALRQAVEAGEIAVMLLRSLETDGSKRV